MIDEIIKLIEQTRVNLVNTIPMIENDIDDIIEKGITSPRPIERLLDVLLDYGYMGVGKKQFMKLNSYYATFNKEYSDKYFEYYKEL